MIVALAIALLTSASTPPSQRTERLVALGRLDAAVRYFNPRVATGPSTWDSLFAANVVRIADAPTSAEYARRISALMSDLHDEPHVATAGQRALVYNGFPSPSMQGSGGYGIGWRGAGLGETYRVDMGEKAHVDVRLSEASADTTGKVQPLAVPTAAEWRASYPTAGYRLLGAARLWSTIRLFYPYKGLIGESWDDQFRAALPAVEGAHDSVEYAKAIAAFAAHINDTHVTVGSASLRAVTGVVPVGAQAQLIEDKLIVTRIIDSAAARAGLRVGDVIQSIDGESVEQRSARLRPLFAASTAAAMRRRLESTLLSGPTAAPAEVIVRSAEGGAHTLLLPRSMSFMQSLGKYRTGSMIRILPGNVGYVDLDRLPVSMVDSAFRVLAATKAIVFDMRGYPLSTAWAIAPRLSVHTGMTTAAKFRRLVVPSPDTARTTVFEFDQPIPPANGATSYTGNTVMLVDERTISQAEHTGLFLEAANGTTFIGSQTMGANGDVTVFTLPGNISISFTGHDVRHADGRQLQRVGLQPQVVVTPTIAGIRAGRDEVLEVALQHVGGTGEIPADTWGLAPEPPAPGWRHGSPPDYRIGIDRAVVHGGSSSGHLTARTSTPNGFGSLLQLVKADNYRGKRVRFSAYVRTRDVVGGAGLWMRVDGNGGTLAFDNMMNRPIRGTVEWTPVSVVLDVPSDADGVTFGVLLASAGEAWVDDASLEIVGTDVRVTGTSAPSPNAANAAQFRTMYASAPLAPVNLGLEP